MILRGFSWQQMRRTCRRCSIVPIAVHQIQTTGSTRTRRIAQLFPVGPPTTRPTFICSQRRSRNDSRHCALLSDQLRLPARAQCSRKCAASPARCDSRTEKYTTCFSWVCRSWSRTRPSRARRCLLERKRRSFTSRCYSISGKEWTLSSRRGPLRVRRFFTRLAIAGSPPLIGKRHSAPSSDLWLIGLQARVGRRCL